MSEFAAALRTALAELGLTQAQLGERVGRDASSVCRWVQGTQAVEPHVAVRIARALGRPELILAHPVLREAAALAERLPEVRSGRRVA